MELDEVWWSEGGSGPVVVVPRLNVDWSRLDLTPLTDRFRVVIVAPRGFAPSGRPSRYDGAGFVRDVRSVLDHLEVDRYATFGYSMNGVMAARLALADPRVVAVACGGFPLTADLTGMGRRAVERNEQARHDPSTWREVTATYDPLAAEAFWADVASLPRGALVGHGRPVRLWWGCADALLASLQDPTDLAHDLHHRAIPYDVLPGLDHDGALERLDLVLPGIACWLGTHLTEREGSR